MASLLDLANRLEARVSDLSVLASEKSKVAAAAMLRYLAYNTPVDTSKALSNWQIGLGERVIGERLPYYAGKYGSTLGESAEAAIADGMQILQQKKPNESIFLSNSADYIVKLNQGTISKQPAGFVQAAIIVGKKAAKTSKIKVRT